MKNLFRTVLVVLSTISTLTLAAQVPKLSSYPSASAVLFLDFDGDVVAGTSWNSDGPIYCDASGLNNTQITEIFNRVSEDYRPFNIDVTTDSTVFLAAPATLRTRVVLTVSSSWYGSSGGVSFVGSFTWGDDTPCFVFSALLGYNVKNIAEAASHEAGHTLGLYHQSSYDANCNKLNDYNYGQGSGEIGWAPIMGAGYYQNLTLWNNGPNSFGCTSYQSDLDIITTNNGFGFRTDDYASTFVAATNASFTGNTFTMSGVIERNTDQDMIKFIQPSEGRLKLTATPYNVGTGDAGSNLDLQVTLFNTAQTQLSMYNPGNLLSSVIDTTLNPGTYYLKIEGKGNVYAPNYASLGSYSLRADFTGGTALPLQRLELHGALNGDKHQLNWIIDADETVTTQVVEISTDGKTFIPLIESPVNDRSYSYKPAITTTAQYRLNVTFDNTHQYYSNVVTLRSIVSVPRPHLISNLIIANTISVSSPGNFLYSIHDLTGKIIGKGQLTNGINTISATQMPTGMYLVRFAGNTEEWTDKLVRQ
jgi:hypothetical protein